MALDSDSHVSGPFGSVMLVSPFAPCHAWPAEPRFGSCRGTAHAHQDSRNHEPPGESGPRDDDDVSRVEIARCGTLMRPLNAAGMEVAWRSATGGQDERTAARQQP